MVIENLNVSSSLNKISDVETLIERVCSSLSVNDDIYGNILISVTEAFNNAVIHGNRNNETLPVLIDVEQKDNSVFFRVTDSGNGFDYNNLPDPTAPENIENECGRGIFLIRNLADAVDFNESGNSIEIGFTL
ncbi:MAG: ATP-binding protein [Flavobacteriia bacterium 40-80]|nr:MAG: ATP-binding protein [Flavobacteriia bacterium 40-80]